MHKSRLTDGGVILRPQDKIFSKSALAIFEKRFILSAVCIKSGFNEARQPRSSTHGDFETTVVVVSDAE